MALNEQAYHTFVDSVTSGPSKNLPDLIARLQELENPSDPEMVPINVSRFMTGGIGLGSEGGELEEIVKKVVFQGKPMDKDTLWHIKREMGDVMWYVSTLCQALGTSIQEVVDMNAEKLGARYPEGFEVYRSENRKDGDL